MIKNDALDTSWKGVKVAKWTLMLCQIDRRSGRVLNLVSRSSSFCRRRLTHSTESSWKLDVRWLKYGKEWTTTQAGNATRCNAIRCREMLGGIRQRGPFSGDALLVQIKQCNEGATEGEQTDRESECTGWHGLGKRSGKTRT